MSLQSSAVFLSITAVIAASSFAKQSSYDNSPRQSTLPGFTEIDRDSSGGISISEAEGTWLADIFAIADFNSDGVIDLAEFTEALN